MLTLPIKKKWFDMIASGEKLEEYRAITPYYTTRFENELKRTFENGGRFLVRLRNGYGFGLPEVIARVKLDTGEGRAEWGAVPGVKYYRLHIIEILVRP